MTELLKTRCSKGWLVITESAIIVDLPGGMRSRTLARSAFTGLDMKLTMWLPGASAYRLTFHGAGAERLQVGMVKGKDAKRVKELLTGR